MRVDGREGEVNKGLTARLDSEGIFLHQFQPSLLLIVAQGPERSRSSQTSHGSKESRGLLTSQPLGCLSLHVDCSS